MGDATSRLLRVALIADREIQGKHLRELLEDNGMSVVVDRALQDYSPEQVSTDEVDVLLVNLDQDTSHDMERLEALIEQSAIPILFNEGGIPGSSGWGRKLVAKLTGLVYGRNPVGRAENGRQGVSSEILAIEQPVIGDGDIEIDEDTDIVNAGVNQGVECSSLKVVSKTVNRANKYSAAPAQAVWVLGASLGGPQAMKSFLSRLPSDLPLGFILAQHIGKPFVPLLAEQLGRVTGMRVMPAEDGRTIRAKEMILVPVDSRFTLADTGMVNLRDEPVRGPYRPCIDEVMEEVSQCYGNQAHAIVFSGMGEDGVLGARSIAQAGGTVWAQEANSCVISSMPDAARKSGVVTYSGTPEELATHLADQIKLTMATT